MQARPPCCKCASTNFEKSATPSPSSALVGSSSSHKDLFEQINDLRKEMQIRLGEHDTQLAAIYDALENLLDKKEDENERKEKWVKRERIGFKK